ncbi:7-carboxy-7-deazaguanine synthase [Geodermatophilus aquaeductus]|uniref:7-carboxy-7-deazaguanine synthase n=1 Tax=Geodermatophilus aquaeductus TaxID=1564161 RepID=A0A521EY89_9ACTN|nr:7-carboxy-7-deazaguanine synthase [Geodermatophilus aquaeductus]SMO88837.1 7-carboxy-7-deazaguanine synthase, Cx14CxxC type [Geodermatophilus aquaeductus]
MKTYFIKEIFYTLQGEGAHAGRPAVFCRFSRCNLWTGLERDRHRAVCQFCDTDFVGVDGEGGGKYVGADALAEAVARRWPGGGRPFVVCTGGEPLLQLDETAVDALHDRGFEIAVETNGTQRPPRGLDWICVSPKAGAELVVTSGDELKLVFPQPEALPETFELLDFRSFRLQPLDDQRVEENTAQAVAYCLSNPQWSLSLQTHKYLRIP